MAQEGSRSFAFDVQAPVQRRSGAQATAPRVGIEGGESSGGVVNATQQTNFSGDSALPAFLEQAFAPQIQQRQQAKFIEGAIAAHSREALNDIEAKKPKWSRLFGDSYYEQGAAFYQSNKTVSDYFSALSQRHDELVKLPPEEVSKIVMDGIPDLMTDSAAANALIGKGVLDNTGPFMDQIVKGRAAYLQKDALEKQNTSRTSAAALLEGNERNYDLMDEAPNATTSGERALGQANFKALFDPMPGQTDESDLTGLKTSALGMLQNKQFRAYRVFKESSGWQRIPLEDRLKIEQSEDRYENLANQEAAFKLTDQFMAETAMLEKFEHFSNMPEDMQRQALAAGYVPPTPANLRDMRAKINTAIALEAGTSKPYFTAEELANPGQSLIKSQYQAANRKLQDIKSQITFEQNEQFKMQLKVQEAQMKAEAGRMAISTGTLVSAVANGFVDKDQADILMQQAYISGDIASLARSFGTGWDYTSVSKVAQQTVSASIGKGYTNSMANEVKRFKAMQDASTGLAMQVYGDHYEALDDMATLLANGETPEAAFDKTLGPKAKTANQLFNVSRDTASKITQSVDKELDALAPNVFGITTGDKLSKSSKFAVRGEIMRALSTKVRGREPSKAEVKGVIDASINSGRIAVYGKYGWVQRGGDTTPLEALLDVDKGTAETLLEGAVKDAFPESLRSKNPQDNITEILRFTRNGKTVLSFLYADPDGEGEHIVEVTTDQLKARRVKQDKAKIEAKQSEARFWNNYINGPTR